MTHVKICGLQRPQDALVAAEAGADFLGFLFASSRRKVDSAVVRDIVEQVRAHTSVRYVGVFVNAPAEEMNRVAREARLDMVQLSGDEPETVVTQLEVPAIQVFHVGSDTDPNVLADRVRDSCAELVLLDSARAGAYGGTGEAFDWRGLPALERPVLLAGGLTPSNVAGAIAMVNPWGVDVSSGVEVQGQKDPDSIRAFIRIAKHAPDSPGARQDLKL